MISDEEIGKGFNEEKELFHSPITAYIAGARFASRLERIKTLEEVKVSIGMYHSDMSATMQIIDRLIEQAKSE